MRRSMWSRLALLAILAIAAVMRLHGIADRSFWLDESFCVRLAQFDWGQVIARSAADNHPPLFYLVLKVWMAVFGDSPLALRSLSVIVGLVTIGLVYVLAARVLAPLLTSRMSAAASLTAAFWIAVHPTHMPWSAEVRMYALAALLAVASVLLLLRALERPTWGRWVAWSAAAIALVYTHYYGAFVVLAQGIHALVCAIRTPAEQRRALIVRVIAAGALLVIAFLPWIGVVISQAAEKSGAWWVPPLTASRALWAWSRMPGLIVEDEVHIPHGGWAVVVAVLACALLAGVIAAAISKDRGLRLVAWCAVVPFVCGVTTSLIIGENVVLARYLIVADMFIPIAIGGVVFRRPLAAVALAPVVVIAIVTTARELPVLDPLPDVPAAISWIEAHRQPGDVIVVHQFYYWTFRIRTPDAVDPALRMFAPGGKPVGYFGSSLVDERDTVWGTAQMTTVPRRMIVVDSRPWPVVLSPSVRWKRVADEWFPISVPRGVLRCSIYERYDSRR